MRAAVAAVPLPPAPPSARASHSTSPRTRAASQADTAIVGSDKILHFVRHGETHMNVALGRLLPGFQYGQPFFRDPNIPDTRLTANGRAQAAAARAAVTRLAPEPEVVVVSPLTRALQTADIMFGGLGYRHIVTPLAAERLYLSSDVGRPREVLEAEFPGYCFKQLPGSCPGDSDDGSSATAAAWWYTEDGSSRGQQHGDTWEEGLDRELDAEHYIDLIEAREPAAAFLRRVERLRQWLTARPESSLAVVTHWGVLHALTGIQFHNCEVSTLRLSQLRARPHLLRQRQGTGAA